MHHHNCFVISAIAKRLDTALQGDYLIKCFSNSIDEIYFEFSHFSFRCIFYKGEIFFSFENEPIGENRLFKPQFRDLLNGKVATVNTHPFERSFHIAFGDQQKLVFKCFGRKSNVLLFNEDGVADIFRKNMEADLELKWNDLFRNTQPVFHPDAFVSKSVFTDTYPSLPTEFFTDLNTDISKENFERLIIRYNNIQSFIYNDDTPELTPNINGSENKVLEVVTDFTAHYLRSRIFSEQKNGLHLKFSTLLKEKENYLKSNSAALEKIMNSRKDEEIGNIILANLHLIKEGDKKAMVNDVYHNVPIEIKLDGKLSALKNADAYFKKDKARPFIIQQLKGKINKGEKEIETLINNLAIIEKATRSRDLKAFIQTGKKDTESTSLPYKYFKAEEYEILVGKHAESNEKLLNYYSDKDDIWLHAKDVGGSHVIIKTKKNRTLPDHILEKAAGLAAYFSKSRNQSLATVIYTQRKFVRKIKGAEKGKVTVSNEKSILVKPGV